ncbi:MAG: hypothetical protein AAGD14_10005 [Planctomycetota bacterium]
METARPNVLKGLVTITLAFVVGYAAANPSGTFWRLRYWMPVGSKVIALEGLCEAEPGGAESELDHALASDDPELALLAAAELARRGEKRGLEHIVASCVDDRERPRKELELLLEDPDSLDDFDSVQEWFDHRRRVLQCTQHAIWKVRAP